MWSRLWLAFVATALLIGEVGCKRSAEKSGPVAFNLTGAPDVISALDRKDHEGAVRALAAVKASLTDDQKQEYSRLLRKVKDVLLERMSTDESAVKAYGALRFLEAGS